MHFAATFTPERVSRHAPKRKAMLHDDNHSNAPAVPPSLPPLLPSTPTSADTDTNKPRHRDREGEQTKSNTSRQDKPAKTICAKRRRPREPPVNTEPAPAQEEAKPAAKAKEEPAEEDEGEKDASGDQWYHALLLQRHPNSSRP